MLGASCIVPGSRRPSLPHPVDGGRYEARGGGACGASFAPTVEVAVTTLAILNLTPVRARFDSDSCEWPLILITIRRLRTRREVVRQDGGQA
jgi:hypothetical protein